MPKNDSLFAGVANDSDDAQARTIRQSSDFELDGENDDTGEDICNFCFLSPCCTSYNHDFVGGGQAACSKNPGLRKIRYKKYWSTLSNLGGWRKAAYRQRKESIAVITSECGIKGK